MNRITSYNVCYTKLLRAGNAAADGVDLAGHLVADLDLGAPVVEHHELRRGNHVQSGNAFQRVITSYSIHYTKLYEDVQWDGTHDDRERPSLPVDVHAEPADPWHRVRRIKLGQRGDAVVGAGLGQHHLGGGCALSSDLGDGITSYQWDFGDGYSSTVEAPSHQFSSA